MEKIKYSVIMPAYNEVARIHDSIVRTHRHLCTMGDDFEIIAVDDGSSDGTGAAMDLVASQLDRTVSVKLTPNRGKGEALRQGFYKSKGEYIFFLDSDMDLPPEQMGAFLETMEQEHSDGVIGSKLHPRSKVDYPLYRRFVSFVYFSITRVLFGLPVRDTQTGLKLFRRKLLEDCISRSMVKAFAYDLELLVIAHHLGYEVAEAPVIIEYRPKYGHIPSSVMWKTAVNTMAVFYRLHILNHYDRSE